ncbi:2-polyprenyl-6-methoxyphenol hydroxylase-like FAD-dependent oxidoreductase [Kroppenstedtia sanguinis]|uniref:FAD-dependent monooxygenase n=1 Tax=Kroppenstedtia sanguinis TaxID=1380684 RepID=UPI003D1F3A7E
MIKKNDMMQQSTETNETYTTSVLVVGGSLVGLSMAMFLASKGVSTVVVERHSGSSSHPRATGFTPRTLELFRSVGIDIDKKIAQVPANFRLRRVRVESITGEWFEESEWTPEKQKLPRIEYSPYRGAAIAQDNLEPILRDKAVELGADVMFNNELINFEQNANCITASIRNRDDGSEYTIRADYLVAADGSHSPVREKVGIGRDGRGYMRTVRSVLFRAPLEEYLEEGVKQFEIDQPELSAFLTTYDDGRWVLMFTDDKERDRDELLNEIQKAIGRSDLDIEIITTGRWEQTALIADSFSSGRVFLVGDAAHTLPPTRGGYGANTGIEDAHNLAWKLSSVLLGESKTQLLDTYDSERRPVAWLRHNQTFARPDYKSYASKAEDNVQIIDDDAIEFGQLYRSTAVIGTNTEMPLALRTEQWRGQPGTRAPHFWVIKDSEQLSTLDLFGHGWVLLTEDGRWSAVAIDASEKTGVQVECFRIGIDVVPSNSEMFHQAFGLRSTGASLIRPDGYVAWRTVDMPDDPSDELTHVLGYVSSLALRTKSK